MKKYGLQLRIPPGQKKQQAPARPPRPPPPFAFKEDDEEDDVESEISRQAAKTKALQKVEEQHKKALEEDPSVFDYDGVYDEMKEEIARPRIQDKTERKSKYIETLMEKAKQREREHEIIYEKKILKERSKDDHLFADKEKFVTSAYKKQLAERAQWLEEERLRQIREEQDDVTKKKDMSEFYFGLDKNIAFGARSEESKRPSKLAGVVGSTEETASGSTSEATPHSAKEEEKVHRQAEKHHLSQNQDANAISKSEVAVKGSSEQETNTTEHAAPTQSGEETNTTEDAAPAAQTAEVYKRSEDAVVAARERFLARKRAKEQAQPEVFERVEDAVALARERYLARKRAKE